MIRNGDPLKNLLIRNIERTDFPAVLDIQSRIKIKQSNAVEGSEVLEHQLKRPGSAGFVALLDGRVEGFLLGEVKTGDFGLEKSFWIINFGVSPSHMGQGIGRSLAEYAFGYCRERTITDVYSVVRWDAGDLLSFFKSLGFDRSNFINLKKKL